MSNPLKASCCATLLLLLAASADGRALLNERSLPDIPEGMIVERFDAWGCWAACNATDDACNLQQDLMHRLAGLSAADGRVPVYNVS